MVKRSPLLGERCAECGHEWRDHPGASFDATSSGACDDCVYERDHQGRPELCVLHAPADAVRDIRQAFIVDVVSGTTEWRALFAWVRPHAAAVALDIPESDEWPADVREAVATLRRRAGISAPTAAAYTEVRTLLVDDEVWGAFVNLADRSYYATVLRSLHGWDPILDLRDEGSAVIVTLTPDEWTSMTDQLGARHLHTVTRRRLRLWPSRAVRQDS